MSGKLLELKMKNLDVPRIQKMNSPLTPPISGDEESGLGFHHTLVRNFKNLKLLGSLHSS